MERQHYEKLTSYVGIPEQQYCIRLVNIIQNKEKLRKESNGPSFLKDTNYTDNHSANHAFTSSQHNPHQIMRFSSLNNCLNNP